MTNGLLQNLSSRIWKSNQVLTRKMKEHFEKVKREFASKRYICDLIFDEMYKTQNLQFLYQNPYTVVALFTGCTEATCYW